MESNQFRALTHLSLQFKRANDENLKKHLSERLQATRGDQREMQRQIGHFQALTSDLNQNCAQLTGDLQAAREEVRRVQDAMEIDTQKKLNELRERMLVEQAEM